ncbi:hypothetical protein C2E23DRAFT_856806 [Lenzites betulinus]|nr:hypothetical protein C2E23DRAFT_856806 [Lenzites betulinus]
MDRATLSKLKRVERQNLAKRDAVKANGKGEMIGGLLQKYHPELFPATLDSAHPQDATGPTAAATESAPNPAVPVAPDGAQTALEEKAQPALKEEGGGAAGEDAAATGVRFGNHSHASSTSAAPNRAARRCAPAGLWAFPGGMRKAWQQLQKDIDTEAKAANVTGADLRPRLDAVRFILTDVKPFAEVDAEVRESLRELGALVDVIERQSTMLREKTARVQRMRLALGTHFFAKLKEDPRLTDGTWTRPTEERATGAMDSGATTEGMDTD